jgi:hypothetical protein
MLLEQHLTEKLEVAQAEVVQQLACVERLAVLKRITTGRSHANVYIVDVDPVEEGGPRGLGILKIDGRQEASNEIEAHRQASASPIGPCMAKLVESTPQGK